MICSESSHLIPNLQDVFKVKKLSNPLFNVLLFERRDEVTRVSHKTSTDKHSINLKRNNHEKGI